MSKRIITTILLLAFLIFNLTACFDTDDLFDNVIIPEGSLPENTEKSTVIEPTEEPTEETFPESEPEVESNASLENKVATFTASVVTEESYGDSLNAIRTMLTTEPVDYSFYKLKVSENVKSAAWSEGPFNWNFSNLEKFGGSVYLGEEWLLSIYENVYGIDGNLIGEEFSNSYIIVFKCKYFAAWLLRISDAEVENGVLRLRVEYGAIETGDDGYLSAISVAEIDKSVFAGEEITSVEFIFCRTEE